MSCGALNAAKHLKDNDPQDADSFFRHRPSAQREKTMIVKCIKNSLPREDPDVGRYDWQLSLVIGKEYRVIKVEADDFRIMDEDGGPYLFPPEAFEVVDSLPDEDWVKNVGEDGEVYWGPVELLEPRLWEDFFDGVESAIQRVRPYLDRLR